MKQKLKIKYRKKENKYIVDYSKSKDSRSLRFDLLSKLNELESFVMYLDSSLGKATQNDDMDYYSLLEEGQRDTIIGHLSQNKIEYQLRTRKREESRKMLGLSVGEKVLVEDTFLVVIIEKGSLDKRLFDLLFNTHDYYLGIHPIKANDLILQETSNADVFKVDGFDHTNDTLADSHFLEYFYTSYDFKDIAQQN